MSSGGAHEYFCSRCKGHTVNGKFCHTCKQDVPMDYLSIATNAIAWTKRDFHAKDSMTRSHFKLIGELAQAVRELVLEADKAWHHNRMSIAERDEARARIEELECSLELAESDAMVAAQERE